MTVGAIHIGFFSYSDIFPSKSVHFEDTYLGGVFNEEKYLGQMYGNYMELPPENKRVCHETSILDFEHDISYYLEKNRE